MILWLAPPFARGEQVVIVLRSGRRLKAEVVEQAPPGGNWPPHMVFRVIRTLDIHTTIGTGPNVVVGVGSREEKADDES